MVQSASKKILIVSNCSIHQLSIVFQLWMPDFEVRGVFLDKARLWISENNRKFIDYLSQSDYVIGIPDKEIIELMKPEGEVIRILPFIFSGLHPDCIQDPSVMKSQFLGQRSSKIAFASYLAGLPVTSVCNFFSTRDYERLGYVQRYQKRKKDFMLMCQKTYGVDIEGIFEEWEKKGVFVYTRSHLKLFMTFDVVSQYLIKEGVFSHRCYSKNRKKIDQTDDPLATLPLREWPVYKGLADALGINGGSYKWTFKRHGEKVKELGLDEFINYSYEVFDASCIDRDAMKSVYSEFIELLISRKAA